MLFIRIVFLFIYNSAATISYIHTPNFPLIPTFILESGVEVTPSNLSCNQIPITSQDGLLEFELYIPYHETTYIHGFFCKKFEYTVSCNTGMSGFSFSSDVHPKEIDQDDCRRAIYNWTHGGPKIPELNYPTCAIRSDNKASNIRIEIDFVSLPLDRSKMGVIHNFFHEGVCTKKECSSVHPNIYWIQSNDSKVACDNLQPGRGYLYKDEYNSLSSSLIDTEYTVPLPFNNICKLNHYCGLPSFRLDNGLLLIPKGNASTNIVFDLSVNLTICQDKSTFKEASSHDLISSTDLSELLQIQNIKCESVLYNYRVSKKIQSTDLPYLGPSIPGIGYGYYITNNTLYQVKVSYERISGISIDCPSLSNCSITFTKPGQNRTFHWYTESCRSPSEEFTPMNITCLWINGIGFNKTHMFYPHESFSEFILAEYNSVLNDGETYNPGPETEDTDVDISGDRDQEKSTTVYESWWDWLKRIIIYILIGILTIIGIIISIKIFQCIKSNKVQGKVNEIHIELHDLHQPNDDSSREKPQIRKESTYMTNVGNQKMLTYPNHPHLDKFFN
ncbi:putative glycoprotein 1 [Hubei lepidoptera virus 2]|uniref:Putative glycoprotein 1 n=1 Tax=Hubei lepidoptera virus 2 TaxID=1922904 RepID=A0A1L3KMR9_9RHAB|nr:putative glycoprotein 1 [Hubei lepidoptera virus 2]APG78682.1 putative glycoprotein 1 [Hubei lepidoptera virus 2]